MQHAASHATVLQHRQVNILFTVFIRMDLDFIIVAGNLVLGLFWDIVSSKAQDRRFEPNLTLSRSFPKIYEKQPATTQIYSKDGFPAKWS